MRRVVVLGAGAAGFPAIRTLERATENRRHLELMVVDRRDHYLYTPLLSHVVSGNLEITAITASLRDALDPSTRFVRTPIREVDLEARELLADDRQIAFDYLLLAPGSRTDWRTAPTCREDARPFGSANDAASIRDALRRLFEERDLTRVGEGSESISVAVIGAGPTGIELAAELATRDSPTRAPIHVQLFEREERIGPKLPPELGKTVRNELEERRVEIRTGCEVVDCTKEGVDLGENGRAAADYVIWCGGRRPARVAEDLPADTDPSGRVRVEADLSVEGIPGVRVAGDAASPPTPVEPRADIAADQGRRAAENLLADLSGRAPTPWEGKHAGDWFLSLGSRDAVVYRNGSTFTGPTARMFYRLHHARRVPGRSNKFGLIRAWLEQGIRT